MDRIGRYKIVRELGHGAMGIVYHAIDPNIGRPVAIKTIRLGEVSNAQERTRLRERLSREARSAGGLSHPGIVTIYDVDQQDELAYIAMEYVDGPTLDDLLSASRPLSPEQLFGILGQTAVALDYAHQKGIVHRDIKPANIMIDAAGAAKIADFGIAKITASEQFTMTGTIVGTPHYMSPEQVQGLTVDGRSDQFSLAVIAYEMLTGEKPFTGEQLTTVVYKIVAEEPPPPTRLNSTLSPQIEAALRKALAKKPDARYRTCQEFVNALEAACASARGWKTLPRGGSLNEPTLQDQPRPGVTALPPPHPRQATTTEYREKRKVGFLPVFMAILMAAGLVALIAWQATPWLSGSGQIKKAEKTAPEVTPPPPPAPEPAEQKPSAAGPPAKVDTQEAPKPAPEETKSAAPPEEPAPEPPPAKREPPPQRASRTPARPALTVVTVISNPPGATATLDGRSNSECQTPCALEAAPGRHTIAITAPGYLSEHREIEVTGGAYQVPLVSLRAAGGTLMLTTVPPGAAVFVDGKPAGRTTPAQISLAPGVHTITVEKDGKRASDRVEIRNGSTTYRKIPLEQ